MPKNNYVMIDLESLDTEPTAVILSIGAVLFNADGIAKDKFYVPVDIQSCIDKGMTISGSTLSWWMQQGEDARKVFSEKGYPIDKALQALKNYIYKNVHSYNVKMCGNSARFDLGILSNAYKVCGQKPFWKYYDERDYRSWTNLNGAPKREQLGTFHKADDDAYSQAKHAIAINEHFGGIIL